MTDTTNSNAQPVLEAGREAYKRIQESGKMLREDWRLVGEALLIGRASCLSEKTGNPNNKAFGAWREANGFSGLNKNEPADAMWLAENWQAVSQQLGDTAANHPTTVKTAYRKATAVPKAEAIKAMKFHRMAHDEAAAPAEAAMAQRQLEKLAEGIGLSVATLIERAAPVCEREEAKKSKEIAEESAEKGEEMDRDALVGTLFERLNRLEQQNAALMELLARHGITVPA